MLYCTTYNKYIQFSNTIVLFVCNSDNFWVLPVGSHPRNLEIYNLLNWSLIICKSNRVKLKWKGNLWFLSVPGSVQRCYIRVLWCRKIFLTDQGTLKNHGVPFDSSQPFHQRFNPKQSIFELLIGTFDIVEVLNFADYVPCNRG